MIIKAPPLVTAEELLDLYDGIDFELVDGSLVEGVAWYRRASDPL